MLPPIRTGAAGLGACGAGGGGGGGGSGAAISPPTIPPATPPSMPPATPPSPLYIAGGGSGTICDGASSGTTNVPGAGADCGRAAAGFAAAFARAGGGGGGGGGAGGAATNAIIVGTFGSRSVAYISGSTTTSVNTTACPTTEATTGAGVGS